MCEEKQDAAVKKVVQCLEFGAKVLEKLGPRVHAI